MQISRINDLNLAGLQDVDFNMGLDSLVERISTAITHAKRIYQQTLIMFEKKKSLDLSY